MDLEVRVRLDHDAINEEADQPLADGEVRVRSAAPYSVSPIRLPDSPECRETERRYGVEARDEPLPQIPGWRSLLLFPSDSPNVVFKLSHQRPGFLEPDVEDHLLELPVLSGRCCWMCGRRSLRRTTELATRFAGLLLGSGPDVVDVAVDSLMPCLAPAVTTSLTLIVSG